MGDVIGGDKVGEDKIGRDKNVTNYYNAPQAVAPDSDAVRALLDRLPLDQIPPVETLPTPHRMPLRPNPLFVGRDEELRTLARWLYDGGTVIITTGMGGMGKTQLAVELAHRYGPFFAGGVFWVSCADPANIPAEVADCGIQGLIVRQDYATLPREFQVKLVYAAWETNIPRLLIFDNCEDETLLYDWLPQTGACRVLVTSRKQIAWGETLQLQTLPLRVLARTESIQLLQQLVPRLNVKESDQIAAALSDLPLALHLAGCYLKEYPQSAADYLAKLSVGQLQHPSLQGKGVKRLPTKGEPNVERVFALSLTKLLSSDPNDELARHLLARAACFAPGEPFAQIWLEMTVIFEDDDEMQLIARADGIKRLLSLGLLERIDEKSLRIHQLLAFHASKSLNKDVQRSVVEKIIGDVALSAASLRIPAAMKPVLPHLRYAVQQAGERKDAYIARLFQALGYYLDTVGAYTEAQLLLERALDIQEQILGSKHLDTATSLNTLGNLYYTQGYFDRAEARLKQALEVRKQILGTRHPDIATSLNSLANLHHTQGNYQISQKLYEQALEIRKQMLGDDNPDTAASLDSIGNLHYSRGDYGKAELLMERALRIREQTLGEEHPDTAASLNALGTVYYAQGYYEKAIPLMERALRIRERMLGEEHPDTAISLNSFGNLHYAQGDYEKSQLLYERALSIWEQRLGSDHPTTANILNNLANLYRVQGNYALAHLLIEKAVAIWKQVAGTDHPAVATSLNNLALLLQAQGDYAHAMPLYEQALDIRQRLVGVDHPDTATSLLNLADLYREQGFYRKAQPLYERALTISQQALGPQSPLTRTICNNLYACRVDTIFDPLVFFASQERQIAQVLVQTRAVIEATLGKSVADRRALATAIEARARWVKTQDTSWQCCAEELRTLIVQLGVEPDVIC